MPKSLPHNIEIEQAILGIYLSFTETQQKIENAVSYEDFHGLSHVALYKYIYTYKELNNDKGVTHALSFLEYLSKQNGALDKCGGYDYIVDLTLNSGTSAGLDSLVSTLKDLSGRRRLITQCSNIITCCYDDYGAEIGDLMGDMQIVLEATKRSLTSDIKEWVLGTEGFFGVTNCDNDLKIVTKRDKTNRRKVLSRMVKDGTLEKDTQREGFFRKIEKIIFEDWQNTNDKPIPFRFPFGMEKYIKMFAGDMVMYAGTKSAGKTALAIETMKLNMREMETFYHSSELRAQTFKMRLGLSKEIGVMDWPVKFSSGLTLVNASDRVQPNGLNVFDYIEDQGEAWRVSTAIAEIHGKLESGIAIICGQRNKDKEFMVGGPQTLAKINFGCNLTKGRPNNLYVQECKAFYGGESPCGWEINYKLVNGITLIPEGIFGPDTLTWRE